MSIFWSFMAAGSFVVAAILTIWFVHVVRSSRPAAEHTGNDRLLYAYSLAGYSCTNLLLRLLILVGISGLGIFSLLCALK